MVWVIQFYVDVDVDDEGRWKMVRGCLLRCLEFMKFTASSSSMGEGAATATSHPRT